MTVYEIIGGVIMLIVAVAIVVLTLCQHTRGQGLSGVLDGSAGGMNDSRITPADRMLAKCTKIAGAVFFVVTIIACVLSSRLG
jgi:preprotein translocase subunit SecG